jgi:hypothetical protein
VKRKIENAKLQKELVGLPSLKIHWEKLRDNQMSLLGQNTGW